MTNRFWAAWAVAAVMSIGAVATRTDFAGLVVGVLDGDTVDVLVDRRPVRIRLAEIDAPEKKQPFGTRSEQAPSDMVFHRNVTACQGDVTKKFEQGQ